MQVEPQLASLSHLSAGSPCRGAGSSAYASGVDLDGEPWANPPSIGCDEHYAGSVTGVLNVAIQTPYTNLAAGVAAAFVADITGRGNSSTWDFGGGTVASNRPYASHAWAAAGDYPVVLRAYSDTYPGGVSATAVVHVVTQPVHYVSLSSQAPLAPYTSWEKAATNIQDAVDAASVAGALVLVSNGVFDVGGRVVSGALTNRVAVTKPLIVQSVNGVAVTIIQGYQAPNTTNGDGAVRCAYLADGAVLAGFTLAGGATRAAGDLYTEQVGGGAWCATLNAVVSNCVMVGNSAHYFGGAAYDGTLINCKLTGNSAVYGGGAYYGTLNNCMLTGNSAAYGGGACGRILTNCTLTGNSASHYGGGAYDSTLNHCLVTSNSASQYGGGAYSCTLSNCLLAANSASQQGGGAHQGTLNNCLVRGNSAFQYGGGAFNAMLNNCTVTGNSVTNSGGGVYGGTVNSCTLTGNSAMSGTGGGVLGGTQRNCIIYYNQAPAYQNYSDGLMRYCCTTPQFNGNGNITNAPLFVDQAGGNLRLQSASRCINAGTNSYVVGSTDLDGRPRIVGGRVDMGAYEYQGPGMSEFIGWLQQYGLPTDGSADHTDADFDGMNNWQEWVAGTDPTNSASLLQLLSPVVAPPALLLRWNSDANHTYFIERATGLGSILAFSLLQSDITGEAGTTTFTDTIWDGAAFYRVGTDSAGGPVPLWLEVPLFMPASVTVTWTSVTNRSYVVERSTSLSAPMLFTPVATNLSGQAGTTSYTDTSASGAGPFLYRVGVQ